MRMLNAGNAGRQWVLIVRGHLLL